MPYRATSRSSPAQLVVLGFLLALCVQLSRPGFDAVSVLWLSGCGEEACSHGTSIEMLAGIAASIGSVGDSQDNAMAEALNGTYKAELIRAHGPWRSRSQAEFATTEQIDWYNTTRLHNEIGLVPYTPSVHWLKLCLLR